MIRVAILGTENSHAKLFAGSLAPLEGEKLFPDVELIGVYGDKNTVDGQKGNEAIRKASACPYFADSPFDFLETADVVMVTSRDGKLHLPYAREYIRRGIPVWVDKPICSSVADVEELVKLAIEHRVPLCGGSSLMHTAQVQEFAAFVRQNRDTILGGHVTAPVNMVNPYGDFWFYSQHLAQMVTTVFGADVKAVSAMETHNGVQAVYEYDRFDVTAFYGTGYSVNVYSTAGNAMCTSIQLSKDFYVPELYEMYQTVKTGESPLNWQEYVAPVYLIDATIRAYQSGKRVEITIPHFGEAID